MNKDLILDKMIKLLKQIIRQNQQIEKQREKNLLKLDLIKKEFIKI